MIYKIGSEREIEGIKSDIPNEVYEVILKIVTSIDDNYGSERDVDNEDGGFVLILENIQDVSEVNQLYIHIDKDAHEYVNLIKCGDSDYLNALFLCNNEFGISVILPKSIAPSVLLDELEG